MRHFPPSRQQSLLHGAGDGQRGPSPHISTRSRHQSSRQVRGIHIAKDLKTKLGPKLKDFRDGLANAPEGKFPEIDALKAEVEAFAAEFPTIGFDKAEGKYTQSL